MSESNLLIAALLPVANVLKEIGVAFFVGGSVASSFHGASRATLDVDIVVNLEFDKVDLFVDQLDDDFYCSKPAILDAIARKSCFNLIHYPTSFKVDVFISKNRPFDVESMGRARLGRVDPDSDFEFPIASPEDTILSKLEWYRMGNEVSERQWEDVVRVLRILGDEADLAYLKSTAKDLRVGDLLERLLESVG